MSDRTETLVARLAESLVGLPYETWNFGDSVAFEALIEASELLGDARWRSFAHGWARAWATRATPFRRLDCTAPGLALVHLAESNRDSLLMQRVVELADYLLTRDQLSGVYETWERSPLMQPYGPQSLSAAQSVLLADPPPGVFLDCMHFDPPFFAALASASGDERYARVAVEQLSGYIALLQQANGLFDHFVLRGQPSSFGPGWGRGQGWAVLGMLDLLDEFDRMPRPLRDEHAPQLVQFEHSVKILIDALLPLQRSDGHWFAVVTNPASGNEFSTAAFMAAGIYRALARGIVSGDEYETAAAAALAATKAGIDSDGTLRGVSAAVMACTEPSHYAHVPRGFRVPWGQGPALLAVAAATRWNDVGSATRL